MAITSETLCKAVIPSSAAGTSSLPSPCSKASFCSSSVFSVNPAEGPHSPSKALTSPGSDNPPKGDGLDFKPLKSQSAGLNLPNSVPDGIKPKAEPNWEVKLQIYSPASKEFYSSGEQVTVTSYYFEIAQVLFQTLIFIGLHYMFRV